MYRAPFRASAAAPTSFLASSLVNGNDFLLLDPRQLRDAGRVLHHVTAANSLLERDARRPVHEVRGRRLQLLAAHPLRALEQRVQDFPMTCLTWHSSGGS